MNVLVLLVLPTVFLAGGPEEKPILAAEASPGQIWAEKKCGKNGVRIYFGEETKEGSVYWVRCLNGEVFKEVISKWRVWN